MRWQPLRQELRAILWRLAKLLQDMDSTAKINWYKRVGVPHSFHQNAFKSSSVTYRAVSKSGDLSAWIEFPYSQKQKVSKLKYICELFFKQLLAMAFADLGPCAQKRSRPELFVIWHISQSWCLRVRLSNPARQCEKALRTQSCLNSCPVLVVPTVCLLLLSGLYDDGKAKNHPYERLFPCSAIAREFLFSNIPGINVYVFWITKWSRKSPH